MVNGTPPPVSIAPAVWIPLAGLIVALLTLLGTFLVRPAWQRHRDARTRERRRPRLRVNGDPVVTRIPVENDEYGSASFDFTPQKPDIVWMWCASVPIKNDPTESTAEGVAEEVRATITFEARDGCMALTVPAGRWGKTPQPTDPRRGTVELEGVQFTPGQTRPLNIAIRHPDEAECYGIDNQSFLAGNLLRRPGMKLVGGPWRVRVTLRGIRVDQPELAFNLAIDGVSLSLRRALVDRDRAALA